MSRLCNLRFYSIIKETKYSTILISNKNVKITDKIKAILYQNNRGYAQFHWKFEKYIYPLYRFLDMLKSKEIHPLLTRIKILSNKYNINYEKSSKKLGFLLSGIGITITLCEAKNYRGIFYYELIINI